MQPAYEPVAGALVSGVDVQGQPLSVFGSNPQAEPNVAISQADGTYALFDLRYTGGPVTVAAIAGGTTRTATAYESNPQDTKSPGLRFARHLAVANVTFPAEAPAAPPPQLTIRVMREANGARVDTRGLAVVGEPLLIGVTARQANVATPLTVQTVAINGQTYGVRADPLQGQAAALGMDVLVDEPFVPALAGAYTIEATALVPLGAPVRVSTTIRVMAAGGSVSDPLPNDPPMVIAAQTVPKSEATGVPVTAYPQVVFTEPVTHVSGSVTLTDVATGETVPIVLMGVGPNGPVEHVDAESVVTSLTVQPLTALKYGTTYQLALTSGIQDLDTDGTGAPAPKALVPYATSFTTFGPAQIGQTETTFTSPGVVVLGDRAYVATPVPGVFMGASQVHVYNVTDPVTPVEVPPPAQPRTYLGAATAPAGEEISPLTGGRFLLLGTARVGMPYGPSNLQLIDAQADELRWVGVVSVGNSPTDGILQNVVLRGDRAFAATSGIGKGIQVIDLAQAQVLFQQQTGGVLDNGAGFWDLMRMANLEGQGFGQQAIVQTVFVDTGAGGNSQLSDLAVLDANVEGLTQPIVVATGRTPLVVVNPQTGAVLFNGPIPWPGHDAVTAWGTTIGVGRAADKDVAVILQFGGTGNGNLAIVDLSNVVAPVVLGQLALDAGMADWNGSLLIRDQMLYVGGPSSTTLVSLVDPAHPTLAGTIAGVGGRLTITEEGLLYGTTHPFSYSPAPEGIKVAGLTPDTLQARPAFVWLDPDQRCSEAPCTVGQPVNVVTGNVFFTHADAIVAGVHGLTFARSYNSHNAYQGQTSVLGKGWTHAWSSHVREVPEEAALELLDDDGVPVYFRDVQGTGRYTAFLPVTDTSVIVRVDQPRSYTRGFLDGSLEIYDAQGRLLRLVDPVGQATVITRDADGRVTQARDPGGRALSMTYDANGRLATLLAVGELRASYTYDAGGQLSTVRYPDGSGYAFTYDGKGQVITVKDGAGLPIETHTYDTQGRGLTSEIADGVERLRLAYDDVNKVTTVTDAAGAQTRYAWRSVTGMRQVTSVVGPCATCGGNVQGTWTWSSNGHVTRQADATGAATSFAYDAIGNVTRVTDPAGTTTTMTHDPQGRVTQSAMAGGPSFSATYSTAGPLTISQAVDATTTRTTTLTYTSRGQVETVTDGRGKTTRYAYSPEGDLQSVKDPLGNETKYGYDGLGRVRSVTDPMNRATTVEYDGRGRVTRVAGPGDQETRYTYDMSGRRTQVSEPLDRKTGYGYDPYGRLLTVTDPANGVTTYGYDGLSHLVSLTDAKQQQTGFRYDERGRLLATIFPGGAEEQYTYDAADRLATKIDRKATTTTYAYDTAGRLTGKTCSDGTPAVTYGYDAVGRLVSAANGSDTITRTYDLSGQLLTEDSAANQSRVSYTYDGAGNRAGLALNGTPFVTYAYDDASRLTAITRGSKVFAFTYDASSVRTSLTMPNGIQTTYSYDPAVRITEILAKVNESPVHRAAYGYDGGGRRTSKTVSGYTETYGYDVLDRLTQVTRDGQPREAYTYDAIGNRLTSQDESTWSYGPRNQLVARGAIAFQYDENGDLVQKHENGHWWRYDWNASDELIRVMKDGVEVAGFAYDPFGRRILKTGSGLSATFAYDGIDILREVKVDGSGQRVLRYVHGPGVDEPLARDEGRRAMEYYHADALGSVVSATDDSGAPVSSRQYDAWGNLEVGEEAPGYAFTGREWDPETALYYYRARYYDPVTGRFISEDPMRFLAGSHFYAYAGNAVTQVVDPTGLAACPGVIFCAPSVLKAIQAAYSKALLWNGFSVSEGASQYEAGFFVNPTPLGYRASPVIMGERNGSLTIPRPAVGGGATFHTHMVGSGLPSTPKDNAKYSSDSGDTVAAMNSGFDVYVISQYGLARAPANTKDPSGKDSHFIARGRNFGEWFNALNFFCSGAWLSFIR